MLFLDDKPVHDSDSERDLGVIVSVNLKPAEQCIRAANSANRVLGCIKLAFKYLDVLTLRSLFVALVRPILEYCSVVWSPSYIKDIDCLERVQCRMTKIIPAFRSLPYTKRLEILTFLCYPLVAFG